MVTLKNRSFSDSRPNRKLLGMILRVDVMRALGKAMKEGR